MCAPIRFSHTPQLVGCRDDDAEKIVNDHIKLLHRYNETKDAAQVRAPGLHEALYQS